MSPPTFKEACLSTQGSGSWPLDPNWQEEVEDGRQSASPPMQHPPPQLLPHAQPPAVQIYYKKGYEDFEEKMQQKS